MLDSKVDERRVGIGGFGGVVAILLGSQLELSRLHYTLGENGRERARVVAAGQRGSGMFVVGRGRRTGHSLPRASIFRAWRRREKHDAHFRRKHVQHSQVLQPAQTRETAVGRGMTLRLDVVSEIIGARLFLC